MRDGRDAGEEIEVAEVDAWGEDQEEVVTWRKSGEETETG
jgi:hypothetical protein